MAHRDVGGNSGVENINSKLYMGIWRIGTFGSSGVEIIYIVRSIVVHTHTMIE